MSDKEADIAVGTYERLLAKAKESVIRDFAPENEIAAVLVMRQESIVGLESCFAYAFKLNGNRHEGRVRIPLRALMDGSASLRNEIYGAMSEDIARFILMNGKEKAR